MLIRDVTLPVRFLLESLLYEGSASHWRLSEEDEVCGLPHQTSKRAIEFAVCKSIRDTPELCPVKRKACE